MMENLFKILFRQLWMRMKDKICRCERCWYDSKKQMKLEIQHTKQP